MKKRKFAIQLFAEGDPTGATTDPATNPAAEGDPKGTEPPAKATTDPAEEKKYSDKDVDDIVSRKKAEWKKAQEKAVDEAKKLANMDAQEKAEYAQKKAEEERDALQKQLDEYRQKDTLSEMMKTSRKMLSDEGISISDELLSVMVTPEAKSTKAAISSFSTLFKAAVEAEVKNRLRGETPKVGTGGGAPLSEIDKRIAKYT